MVRHFITLLFFVCLFLQLDLLKKQAKATQAYRASIALEAK